MPYYQRLGEVPRKHHIWFHRNGSTPSLQERRHRLRARFHDARIRRGVFDHVSPAAADASAQCRVDQILGAEESSR